jgi:hypothetical protein
MSGLHLQSRRGTTAEHPGQGTAYRDGANLARICGVAKRIFGRPSGSRRSGRPSHLGAGEAPPARHVAACPQAGKLRKKVTAIPKRKGRAVCRPALVFYHSRHSYTRLGPGSRSACRGGPDEPAEAAKFALGSRLLRRKHVVPCDLQGVSRIEYVKHRDVLPFVWFPIERRMPSLVCSMPIPLYAMLRTRRGVSHFKCSNRFCAAF